MRSRFSRCFIATLILSFSLSGITSASAAFQQVANNSSLSNNGQRAFDDLGRCLQSQGNQKVLDVFYLIDESASLQATDADNRRAEILSSSLLQLASFRKGVTVNYSVAFFAHSYGVWKPWSTVNTGSIISDAARVDAEVRKRNKGNLTDWLQGINGAIKELNAQHERTGGCSTLVWLTDGGIELTSVGKTVEAINELCDNKFDVLRKNQVTVLGVLLKNDQALDELTAEDKKKQLLRMAYMQPMIEGVGTLYDGSEKKCGANPVPANYHQGALFVAQDPKDLAYEFLKLPPQIEGCKASPNFSGTGGEFKIENGISDFQIVTTSPNWNLTNPSGKPMTSQTPGVKVFDTAGAAQIRIGTTQSGTGTWKFSGPGGSSQLFICSGLDIVIDKGVNPIAGRAGILSGKVVYQKNGEEADLSVYDSDQQITVQQVGNGKSGKTQKAEQSPSAKWVVEKFTPTAGQDESEVRITLYLKTKGGFQLAPISISQKLDVRLIANYPTLKTDSIQLSDLTPPDQPATGVAVFKGSSRSDGKVCIDPKAEPVILKDKVHRENSFILKSEGLDIDGCAPVRSGEEVQVKFTASNEVTASADVVLAVPIAYFSDADPGKSLVLNAPVTFKSHTINEKGKLPWVIGLTVAGILLPLGLIYLLLWWATRIAYGRQLQRAEYPIAIGTDGKITARDGSPIVTQGDNYFGKPQQADMRVVEDGGAILSAKLPKFVLSEPWYEVKAPEGSRVISVGNIAQKIKSKKRFTSRKLAPIVGDMGKIWYILLSDAALMKAEKGSPIDGKLVIFNRRNNSNLNQHRESFSSVASKPGLGKEVEQLITVVKTEQAPKPSTPPKPPKGGEGGSPSGGGSGPTRSGGPGSPGRPGGAGAPGAPTRPNFPGGPTRSGPPSSGTGAAPTSSGRGTPPTPGGPSRPGGPGAPGAPRRGGPGAPS
jgi:hypothetical protein